MQYTRELIIIIDRTTIYSIQMLADGRIKQFSRNIIMNKNFLFKQPQNIFTEIQILS